MINRNQNLKKQKGVVIVIALFIVALVAAMAYIMMMRLMRDTERTTLIVHDRIAENKAEGSVLWAIDLLKKNWNEKKPNQLIDQMPITSPEINDEDGYKIKSTIDDMQSRFNLNNLSDVKAEVDFIKLIRLVDKNMSQENAASLAKAVTTWILGNAGADDQYYLKLPIPYRSAHRFMQSTSELQLVKGMTPELYRAIKPYIVALPTTTLINIQTAGAPVIATLKPTLTIDAAKALLALRAEKPFASIDDVLNSSIGKNYNLTSDKMTVISRYFLVETEISIDAQHIVIYTLLERTGPDGKAIINRLWQSKGVWQ